jgi:hypothetical protein
VSFDPTGGGRAQLAPLPSGRPEATPPPGANPTPRRPSPTIQDQGLLDPDFDAPTGPGGTIDVPTNPAPFIATTLFLLLAVGALALAIWVRGPRGELQPDAIWGSIGRFAGRLGLGPRPTETVYEYAGALGELMPDARPALQTVADAKVEVAYGRGSIDGDRLHAMRDANRTLRLALLRLGFRPRRRRRR